MKLYESILHELELNSAKFEVVFKESDNLDISGGISAEFFISTNAGFKKIFAKVRKCLIFQGIDVKIIPCELCSLFVIDIQSQTAVTIRLSRTQSDSRRKPAVFAGKSRDGFFSYSI